MTSDLSTAELDRILDAVDLIEECLGRLVQTHKAVGREEYRTQTRRRWSSGGSSK